MPTNPSLQLGFVSQYSLRCSPCSQTQKPLESEAAHHAAPYFPGCHPEPVEGSLAGADASCTNRSFSATAQIPNPNDSNSVVMTLSYAVSGQNVRCELTLSGNSYWATNEQIGRASCRER